ncbi:MAG: HD domain-containing protein, partial [Deltaproteobacteria bacterium]|nr:HD domain-containing protein [Deltaproteobacteria bacterium]
MSTNILDNARTYLFHSFKGKQSSFETKHPWRKDWKFAVLHSLRVESYTLKILAREPHSLPEHEIVLIRLAAILHDLARMEDVGNHAKLGAEIAEPWLRGGSGFSLTNNDIERVLEMIADHSNKNVREQDFSKAILKDADILDEIGVMSIFMTSNWLDRRSPFFFYDLRQRLIEFEIPFCDKQMSILNTHGAREILSEKKAFVENFIAQLTEEVQADGDIEQIL